MFNQEVHTFLNAFIINLLLFVYQDVMYNRKYEAKYWYVFSCILNTGILFLATIAPVPLLNTIYLFVSLLTITSLLYTAKIRTFIIYDTIIVAVFILLDILMSSNVGFIVKQTLGQVLTSGQYYAVSNVTVLVSYFMAVPLILKIVKKDAFDAVVTFEIFMFLVSTILEVILVIYITISNYDNSSSVILANIYIVSIVFCIQVFGFFKLASYYTQKKNQELELIQSVMLYRNYEELKNQNDTTRKVFHDIQNHISTLTGLMQAGLSEEAETYKYMVEDSLDILDTNYKYQNQALDIIINNKRRICEKEGIDLNVNIRETGIEQIEPYDLITILGNLLDNAIEECSNTIKKYMEIRIYKYEFFVVIHVRNTCTNKEIVIRRGGIKSTKYGHFGIGLRNVEKVISKYNGTFSYKIVNQEFQVDVCIPIL